MNVRFPQAKFSFSFLLAGKVCACVLSLSFVSGCASLHEGAYVGNDASIEAQKRHPDSRPTSSVPLFASQDVKDDARNRGAMEKSTGRPVAARPVTVNDVVAWHQAGVADANIMTHIRTHGLYQPLQSQDVLTLQNHGVSVEVIRTMKEHPYPKVDAPTPPPSNRANAFTRNSRNPDTNPGNGYYVSGNTGSNPQTTGGGSSPTVAPPVQSSGDGKPRLQSARVAPAYGASAGEIYCPGDGVIIMDGNCMECYDVQ